MPVVCTKCKSPSLWTKNENEHLCGGCAAEDMLAERDAAYQGLLAESQAREAALREAIHSLMQVAQRIASSSERRLLPYATAARETLATIRVAGVSERADSSALAAALAAERAKTAAAKANAAHLDGLHTNACVRMGELAAEAGAAEARELALREALEEVNPKSTISLNGRVRHELPVKAVERARRALAAPTDNTELRALMVKAATAQREADHTFASDGPETRPEAVVDAVLKGES